MPAVSFDWNPEKNELLRRTRGIGFEEIVAAVQGGFVLADLADNPARPNQRRLVVEIDGYAITVPYVTDGRTLFLKTLFPDRKAKRRYLRK